MIPDYLFKKLPKFDTLKFATTKHYRSHLFILFHFRINQKNFRLVPKTTRVANVVTREVGLEV